MGSATAPKALSLAQLVAAIITPCPASSRAIAIAAEGYNRIAHEVSAENVAEGRLMPDGHKLLRERALQIGRCVVGVFALAMRQLAAQASDT